MDAELALARDESMALEAACGYLARSKELQAEWRKVDTEAEVSPERLMFAYHVADAELFVVRLTEHGSGKEKKWQKERASLAKAIYEKTWEIFRRDPGRHSVEDLFQWSSRWRQCGR
jgi:hypothetical protein